MDLKSLKLQLVRKIMLTNDRELLETIQQILEGIEPDIPKVSPAAPPQDLIAQALGLSTASYSLEEDTKELQQSIDELLGPRA
ncbi:MAG: hypothetical protein R2828_25965 [Saprospiraceae bacterium]